MVKTITTKTCDKCGNEITPTFGYQEYRIETIDFGTSNYDMRKYELCRECFWHLQNWIDPWLFEQKVEAGYYSIKVDEKDDPKTN